MDLQHHENHLLEQQVEAKDDSIIILQPNNYGRDRSSGTIQAKPQEDTWI